MIKQFITEWLGYAFKPSVSHLDTWSLVAGLFISAWYGYNGKAVPEEIVGKIGLCVVILVFLFVLFRLIVGPYVLWKKLQIKIKEIESTIAASQNIGWSHNDAHILIQKTLIPKRLEVAQKIWDIGMSSYPFSCNKFNEMRELTEPVFDQCQPFLSDEHLRLTIFHLRIHLVNAWSYAHATNTNIPPLKLNQIANAYNGNVQRYSQAAYDLLMGYGENSPSVAQLNMFNPTDQFGEWLASGISTQCNEFGPDEVTILLSAETLERLKN